MVKSLLAISLIIISSLCFAQNKNNEAGTKQQQEMMAILNTKPKIEIKAVGILLYDGYQTLDALGPYEVLSQLRGANVFFVAKQKGLVSNQRGMKIQVDHSIHDITHLDILVIPGGAKETFIMTQDTSVLHWIQRIDKGSIYTTSVCTGAWILGAAGLLEGKKATTNWYRAEEMLNRYGAMFKRERWVRDGKYWTSAGVTAGLDMSLAIINELMGETYTQGIMLNLEYDPHPPLPGGSVDNTNPLITDLLREMYDHSLLPLIEGETKN